MTWRIPSKLVTLFEGPLFIFMGDPTFTLFPSEDRTGMSR